MFFLEKRFSKKKQEQQIAWYGQLDEAQTGKFNSGVIQGTTQKKDVQKTIGQKQEKIDLLQRRFEVLVQGSSDVFQIIGADGTIIYISPAVEKILGYQPEELIGKNVLELLEEPAKVKLKEMIKTVLTKPMKKAKDDIEVHNRAGKRVYLAVQMLNQLSEQAIQGIVLNWSDITERIESQRMMEHIATHDELTDLPNRAYFQKELRRQCEEAKASLTSFALLLLDIDGFKYINHALGYSVGDQLIVRIAQKLKGLLDESVFISRYSGDQFALIIPGFNTIHENDQLAREIIALFSNPVKVDKYELGVTLSMGISLYPGDAQEIDTLIKFANIALLRAKRHGRNRYEFYFAEKSIPDYKQFVLRNDLRKAVERNQLVVYYQPQVNLENSKILAAEALIRWDHPDWGLVSSKEFIHLAEETGFIIQIGHWLLNRVCQDYKQWLKAGLPDLKIALNYSVIQFFEENFVQNIEKIIAQYGLSPRFLVIEITESVLIRDSEKIAAHIRSLHSLGIQVALDDFGTGFSSLSYLKDFNIDLLKLDRSFIKKVNVEKNSALITSSLISLGHELGIKLVAEGIETREQLSALRKMGCYAGQGYLYSKPLPVKEFVRVLAKGSCQPMLAHDLEVGFKKERRKYFRVEFPQLLEAEIRILRIGEKRVETGTTKVVIKNMGPGGLCFNSNIRFPINRDIILQFETQLLNEELIVYGRIVWTEELDDDLFEYGLEFTFDENDRMNLTRVLNQVQVKIKNNPVFTDGNFVEGSPRYYFNQLKLNA